MTANVNKWSKTAATNATADPDINWAEGQVPSTVNNSARGNMQGIANYRDDIGGQLTLAGGTTVYTLTTNSVNSAPQLVDGLMVCAVVNAANTGATTLNVDALGAKNVYKAGASGVTAIGAGDLTVDMHALFQYDASLNAAAGGWVLLNQLPPAAAAGVVATFDAVADANQTMAAGKVNYTWTTLTAARTSTLLAASAYAAGQRIILADGSGNASSTVTITATINPAPGTDTIVGDAVVNSPHGRLELICDGSSKFYGKQIRAFGTAAQQALALDSSAKVPAVDGSQLLNVGIGAAGGRLTLTTAVPVLTATVTAAGTVYYTPYTSQFVPIYNGTIMAMTDVGGELSNILANSAVGKAGPAAAANNSNYDLFAWNDSGTYRLSRGPLWTSDTARGSGAGTTELVRVKGIMLNANDITNGPAAQRGTYVGTVRTNGTATVDYQFGALAAGGTPGIVGVWNMYNRLNVGMFVQDNTNSWSYSTTTIRPANNSTTMRVSFVCGLAEDRIHAVHTAQSGNGTDGGQQYAGIGYDSTSVFAAGSSPAASATPGASAALILTMVSTLMKATDLGYHEIYALERGGSGATTWYGDNGAALVQNGLYVEVRA